MYGLSISVQIGIEDYSEDDGRERECSPEAAGAVPLADGAPSPAAGQLLLVRRYGGLLRAREHI